MKTKYKILLCSILCLCLLGMQVTGCKKVSDTVDELISFEYEDLFYEEQDDYDAYDDFYQEDQSAYNETRKTKSKAGSISRLNDSDSLMKVHFIDVGQGDAILIECGNQTVLIDAGEQEEGSVVIDYVSGLGIEKLDYVIATHPHSDHIGGLPQVIEAFDVGKVIMPKKVHSTKTYKDLLSSIEKKHLKITESKVGREYTVGTAAFTIIAPAADYDDLNNWSVGILLVNGDNRFVMYGDAESNAEADICETGIDIKADVLKLGHHGSSTSSSQKMLDAVSPTYAVIMCGTDNSYGHPHKETIKKLNKQKIQYFRTDKQGTIIAESDGTTITWNCDPVKGK